MAPETMRRSNFNAAQRRNGKDRYASGYVLTGPGNQPPKTIMTTNRWNNSSTAISSLCPGFSGPGERHDRMNGATISAPNPSPIHQVNQSDHKFAQSAAPPRQRLKLPIVALTTGAKTAAPPTNRMTSPTESNVFRQPTTLCSNQKATTASSVFP